MCTVGCFILVVNSSTRIEKKKFFDIDNSRYELK